MARRLLWALILAACLWPLAWSTVWAQIQGVPVLIETDPVLRGGSILIRKADGGAWVHWPKKVSGVPVEDVIVLQDQVKYEIKVEKPEFWNIQWGHAEFLPMWQSRNQLTEASALLLKIKADPSPQFNAAGVTMTVIIPGALVPLVAVLLLLRRTARKKREVERAAAEQTAATTIIAKDILSKTKVPLPVSLRVGRYKIMDLIGDGGMASVYRVMDETGGSYAMKIPHRDALSDRDFAERFKREIGICVGLNHACVIRTYDAGSYESEGLDIPYMVMELVKGKALDDLLMEKSDRDEPPDMKFALWATRQVTEALVAAHDKMIIHRDIKPGNVMLTQDNHIKVMDFGIARSSKSATLTARNSALGTPAYMAPEQVVNSRTVDHRADLYALGVLMYALFTHRVPFYDEDLGVLIMRKMTEPPVPPHEWNPDVPPGLEAICLKLMEKDAKDRFQTSRQVLAALEYVEQHPSEIPPGAERVASTPMAGQAASATHAGQELDDDTDTSMVAQQRNVAARDTRIQQGAVAEKTDHQRSPLGGQTHEPPHASPDEGTIIGPPSH